MPTSSIWDPEHKYESENSPFLIVNSELKKFRPIQALRYLQDDSYWSGQKEIIWAGLAAWMIAPSGPIKTSTRNIRKLSAPEFVYQSMLVAAANYLDGLFNDARLHQWHLEEYSNETLFERLTWDEADFELFFVLGGFRAILDHSSASEFRSNVENQAVVVEHAWAVFQELKASANVGAHVGQKAIFDKLSTPPEKERRRRGEGPSTLRGHWDALASSAPFLFAVKEMGGGELISNVLQPHSRDNNYTKDFAWVGPCVSRAQEVARLLNDQGWGPTVWPPIDCVR
jgi:hypothetical protein